jgi:hypothetical protein
MEKFLLLVREDLNIMRQINEEERYRGVRQMLKWVESLAESGNYIGGEPLLTTGKYVSRDKVLSDGPFIEAKEGVSGYIFLQAENLEQAASIAQTCPLVLQDKMHMEVRPIMTLNNTLIDG